MGRFVSKINFNHISETPGGSYGTLTIIGTNYNNSRCFREISLHICDRSEVFFSLTLLGPPYWRWNFFFLAVSKPLLPFQSQSNHVLTLLSPSVSLWSPIGLPESPVMKRMIIKYRKMILTLLLPLASWSPLQWFCLPTSVASWLMPLS